MATPVLNGTWQYKLLYSFNNGPNDGSSPYGSVSIGISDPGCPADKHKIEGMTPYGGSAGLGTVFEVCEKGGKATERVLHSFQGGLDGAYPYGSLLIDKSGNFYGLTSAGGGGGCTGGCGTAFKFAPPYGPTNETVIYTFMGGVDGAYPIAGLMADAKGNLFGTTSQGGGGANCAAGCGTVFELRPSGSGYTASVLYSFLGGVSGPDGALTESNLITDKNGNLYGTTTQGGSSGGGTVFELQRKAVFSLRPDADVTYTEKILHNFNGTSDGATPYSCVVMNKNGYLYGTTYKGGSSGLGTIYSLKFGTWSFNVVHSFLGGGTDGAHPAAAPLLTASGGGFVVPTTGGGSYGGGVVEAAPDGSFNSSRSNYC
jgi:uncharacterized repeat protein (TIGR03803 family)